MKAFYQWLRNKFGRIVTGAGILLQGVETFDVSAIKDPLESFIGHKGVQGLTVALFVLSWARHQQIANKHPKDTPLPNPEAVRP